MCHREQKVGNNYLPSISKEETRDLIDIRCLCDVQKTSTTTVFQEAGKQVYVWIPSAVELFESFEARGKPRRLRAISH